MTNSPEKNIIPEQPQLAVAEQNADAQPEASNLVEGFGENMQNLHAASEQLEKALIALLSAEKAA